MASKQTYFCWIRLLRLDSLASVQIAPQATVEPFDYYLTGHRPPWAARSLDSAVSDDLDFWFAERNVGKPKSKLVFQSGPAYRRRVSAMAWLQSREGKRWAREAENYMLMNFEREPADAAPSPPPAPPTGKGVRKPKPNPKPNPATGEGLYPSDQWDEPFKKMIDAKPVRELFTYDDFSDPKKWGIVGSAGKTSSECPVLLKYKVDGTRDKEESTIIDEAIEEQRAIQPVLDAFGLDYSLDPEAMPLVGLINDNANYPIYQLKEFYGRARPRQRCTNKLDPMFPPGHFLHPGHGAYPSGHATLVHMWAELIGELQDDPKLKATLKAKAHSAATAVAKRREIAGLHYPSDSVAGEALGINIAQRILKAGRLTLFEKMALLQQS